jgi:hypothetical protein
VFGNKITKQGSLQNTSPSAFGAHLGKYQVAKVKGTVQQDLFGQKWYQPIGFSLRERRRDFQLILSIPSQVRGPLSFRATSYGPWKLTKKLPCQTNIFVAPYLIDKDT